MVLIFIQAPEPGLGPPRFSTGHSAGAYERATLQGLVPVDALVVKCLPHHEMISSVGVFMFPRRWLSAATWKRESQF